MSKYIDLAPRIIRDTRYDHLNDANVAEVTLSWLDNHPDQAPGRTITESEFAPLRGIYVTSPTSGIGVKIQDYLGITVVPDPEPTNAERIEALLRAADEANADQEFGRFARYLDKAGVKAPEAGGDDE